MIVSIWINVSGQQSNDTIIDTTYQGEYLGLNFPDTVPEIFAPKLISGKGRLHCFPSFSVDNKEIYWLILPPKIMTIKEVNGKWTNPELAAFSTSRNTQAPFVAYDNTIYFSSSRQGGQGSLDIWYATKIDSSYGEPINIGDKINTGKTESHPTVSKNRTIFYTGTVQGKRYNKGIYYSFYENGEWSEPVDLSLKMNFNGSSKFPYVSPDGKFLFFSSGENIYWIDSKILQLDYA